jgi:hypothetical protein
MEEEQKIIRLENEKIKVVFINEVNPDESSLTLEFTITRDSNDQKVTTLALDPSLFDREDSFMGEMYMNTVNTQFTTKDYIKVMSFYKNIRIVFFYRNINLIIWNWRNK